MFDCFIMLGISDRIWTHVKPAIGCRCVKRGYHTAIVDKGFSTAIED